VRVCPPALHPPTHDLRRAVQFRTVCPGAMACTRADCFRMHPAENTTPRMPFPGDWGDWTMHPLEVEGVRFIVVEEKLPRAPTPPRFLPKSAKLSLPHATGWEPSFPSIWGPQPRVRTNPGLFRAFMESLPPPTRSKKNRGGPKTHHAHVPRMETSTNIHAARPSSLSVGAHSAMPLCSPLHMSPLEPPLAPPFLSGLPRDEPRPFIKRGYPPQPMIDGLPQVGHSQWPTGFGSPMPAMMMGFSHHGVPISAPSPASNPIPFPHNPIHHLHDAMALLQGASPVRYLGSEAFMAA
jgi:hypothetical protein